MTPLCATARTDANPRRLLDCLDVTNGRYQIRAWGGPQDTPAMQELASRRWPAGPHAGGVGWAAAIEQLGDQIVLAERDEAIVGWASLSSGELQIAADRNDNAAAEAMLSWALDAASDTDLTLAVADGDEVVRSAALAAGFAPVSGAKPGRGMVHAADADRLVRPALPAGYTIRSVEDGEEAARVECHRAAWLPRLLPWPPGDRPPIPADATSRFTARHYEEVRRTWLYDQSLDLVVVAPDGTFAGCCIAWYDSATRSAEIEPLGVIAEHRRRGLAGSLTLDVVARIAGRGGTEVFINSDPGHDYWVPSAAYAKAGFRAIDRTRPYRRAAG